MESYIFDTNVLIDLVLQDIFSLTPNQLERVKLFSTLPVSKKIVSISTVGEFSAVMQKVIPYQISVKHLELIKRLTINFISLINKITSVQYVQQEDFLLAMEIYTNILNKKSYSKTFDLNDALIIALTRRLGAELITNDKEVLKYADLF